MERQTERQADRQTDRESGRQTNRGTDWQTDKDEIGLGYNILYSLLLEVCKYYTYINFENL